MAVEKEPSRPFPSRTDVGAIVILGAIFLIALAPKLDTDLWWHLWDGRYILDHHAVPTADFLSFTAAGDAWTDHEWLAEIFLYGLYQLGGLWGTIIGFAVVILATFILVYVRMLRGGVTPFLAMFVLLFAFVSSSSTWAARPQMLTLLFLAAFALLLDVYMRNPAPRLAVLFPLLMVLWANLHGGWVLGIVLMGVTVVGEWLNLVTHRPGAMDGVAIRNLAISGVVTLAATVLTPNGVAGLLYPLVWITPGPFANVLTEWVSVDFHQFVYMVFEAMLLIMLAALFLSRRAINWTWLLLILTFTYLALSETRNVAVWSVVVSPVLAFFLQGVLEDYFPRRDARPRSLRPGRERAINVALLVLVAIIFPVELLHYVTPNALRSAEASTYPKTALTYMTRHPGPTRVLAAYAWGGYLIWRGYPPYRDFIDGRANTVFTPAILRDYLNVTELQPHWQRILQRHRVDSVLIEPNLPLAAGLAQDPAWERVYRDRVAVLYTRTGSS
jgi:hypothetical protein